MSAEIFKDDWVKKLPLDKSAKWLLHNADDEARKFGHHYLGSEHLLLGMMTPIPSKPDSQKLLPSGQFLVGEGFNYQKAKEGVEFIVGRGVLKTPVRSLSVNFDKDFKKIIEVTLPFQDKITDVDILLGSLLRLDVNHYSIAAGILESYGKPLYKLLSKLRELPSATPKFKEKVAEELLILDEEERQRLACQREHKKNPEYYRRAREYWDQFKEID